MNFRIFSAIATLFSMPVAVRRNILALYIIKIAKWFMLVMPIFVPFLRENGMSLQEIMLLKSYYSAAIVILEIPSGYLSDVIGRRNTLIAGAILGTAGYLVYSLSSGFAGFMMAELVLGAGISLVSGADSATLHDSLAEHGMEHQYIKYEGNTTSIGNFAEAAAALVAGLMVAVSLRYPFYAQTVVASIAIPAAIALREPPSLTMGLRPTISDVIKTAQNILFRDRKMSINILFSSVMGAATLTMAWFVQPLFEDLGVELRNYDKLWAALNVILGIFSIAAYSIERRLGERATLIFLTFMIPAGFILTALSGMAWSLIIIAIFYMSRGIATPVLKGYINRLTRNEVRATVLSVRNFIIRLLFMIIAPVIGGIADRNDLSTALLITGTLFALLLTPLLIAYLHYVTGRYHETPTG